MDIDTRMLAFPCRLTDPATNERCPTILTSEYNRRRHESETKHPILTPRKSRLLRQKVQTVFQVPIARPSCRTLAPASEVLNLSKQSLLPSQKTISDAIRPPGVANAGGRALVTAGIPARSEKHPSLIIRHIITRKRYNPDTLDGHLANDQQTTPPEQAGPWSQLDYKVKLSRNREQCRGLGWLTEGARRRFTQFHEIILQRWGLVPRYNGPCLLLPDSWDQLEPAMIERGFNVETCPGEDAAKPVRKSTWSLVKDVLI